MSRALDHRLGISPEASAGTTDTNPTVYFVEARTTAPAPQTPKQQSMPMRRDGNMKSSVPLNRSANYGYSMDLTYPVANEGRWREIQAALRAASEAAQVSMTNATHGVELSSTNEIICTDSFVTQGVQKGDVLEISSAPNSADDGFVVVESVDSATQITIRGVTWTTTGACTIKRGARMANGTTDRSFTLEECWVTSTGLMNRWVGMRVNSISLGFSMGQKSTYSVSYVGRDCIPETMQDWDATPTPIGLSGTVTYNDYTESPVFTPGDEITAMVDGVELPIESFQFTTTAGARTRHSIQGGATPDAIPTGMCRVTFQMTTYASVLDHIADARTGDAIDIFVAMKDPDGKAIAVSLGACVFDQASLPMGGVDQDARVTATGTANMVQAETTASQDYGNWTVKLLRFQ